MDEESDGPRPMPVISVAGGVQTQSKLVSWSHFSWLWVAFSIVLLVGNGILMVFLGFDLIGAGISNPLVLVIWHFVLAMGFGIITVVSAVFFTQEELLQDRLRLPILSGLWSLYNGVGTILFLGWIIDHPSLHSDVQFNDNPSAYASFVGISGVLFLWFWVNVAAMVIAWVVHYNQRKYLEVLNRSLQVSDFVFYQYHGITIDQTVKAMTAGGGVAATTDGTEQQAVASLFPAGGGNGAWSRTTHIASAAVPSTRMIHEDPVRGMPLGTRPPSRRKRGVERARRPKY